MNTIWVVAVVIQLPVSRKCHLKILLQPIDAAFSSTESAVQSKFGIGVHFL